MRKSVFHALLIGTCVTLGLLSGCGKKEMPVERPIGSASSGGEPPPKEVPILVGQTEKCNVFRVYDRVVERHIYFLEAVHGENLRCGGITTP